MFRRRVRRWLVSLLAAVVLSLSIVPEITLAADGGLAQPDSQAVDKGGPKRNCNQLNASPDLQCGW
jgi:hypothetical protein